ncbi:MAG: hypothetical protein J6T55_02865 [Alphaproteobacteria bacterium]|nr:hypothetical protein [Alphaproteobacteria bacterium]
MDQAGCNALYPEGWFRTNYGECYSCSYENAPYTSKAECDKCGALRYQDGTHCWKK